MITIGFLELNSIAKGILAADMMLKAAEIKLSWPLDFDMTDSALERV